MEDILILTTISNVNSRGFDVEMNKSFTGDEVVTVYPTAYPDEKLQAKIVLNTQVNSDLARSIVIGPSEYIPATDPKLVDSNPNFTEDTLLKNNVEYTVEIFREGEIAKDNFRVSTYPGIVDCVVNSYGNRIITVDFKYPLRNLLDHKEVDAGKDKHDHLTNFYILYYGLDSEAPSGVSADKDWVGYIGVKSFYDNSGGDPTSYTVYPFRVDLSDDGKRIEIQRNYTGIPLGEHKLIVNYAKQQKSLDEYIIDFSENETPVIGKDFIITRDAIAAKPVELVALSRTEVIVKFDKAVILLDAEKNIFKLNETALVVESYERYGYGFNEVKYTLDLNSALPVGESVLTVNPVTDASGYKTQETNLPIIVDANRPELLLVEQVVDNSEVETKIKLIYSDIMNTEVAGEASVINEEKYQILDEDNIEKLINSVEIVRANENEFLMKTELLPAGMYKLVVTNVKDELNTVIDPNPTEKVFEIKDYSVPKVIKVIATNDVGEITPGEGPISTPDTIMSEEDNAIVIMFNEPMNIIDPYSAIETTNYMLINGNSGIDYKLNDDSTALAMKDNKWIRLTIPYENGIFNEFTRNLDSVSIGYSDVREVKYVTNASGNIYPLCDDRTVDVLVDKLDITGTAGDRNKVLIITDSTIHYVHDSGTDYDKNIFYDINKEDFLLRTVVNELATPGDPSRYGETLPILAANLIDDVTVEFTFAKGSFDSSTTALELSTIEYEKILSLDIFGKRILGKKYNNNVINKVKSTLKGVSFLKLNNTNNLKEANGQAIVAMRFTKDIAMISDDFTAIVQGNSALYVGTDPLLAGDPILDGYVITDPPTDPITLEQKIFANKPNDVVVLKVGVPDVVDNKTPNYFVSTSGAKGGIKTFDTNRNPIKEFSNIEVVDLNNEKFEWKYTKDGADSKYTFILTFSDEVKINTADTSAFTVSIDGVNQKAWKLALKDAGDNLVGTFVLNFLADQDPAGLTTPVNATVSQPPLELEKIIIEIVAVGENLPDASAEGMFAIFNPEPYSIINVNEEHYINLDYQPPSEIV